MKLSDMQRLAQAMDSTFGRSSSPTGTFSMKASFVGEDTIKLVFTTIVNLVSVQEIEKSKKRCSDEAEGALKEYLKKLKSDYKDLGGGTLSLKEVDRADTFEVIDLNIYNAKKTAYFRKFMTFKVS